MSTATTAQQESWFNKLVDELGAIFSSLFKSAKKDFNNLPPDQRDALIKGVNISQIIKDGYSKGEAYVVGEVSTLTGLDAPAATQLILSIATDAGVNTNSVQAYLDTLANKVQSGITDNGWNALFSDVAAFAASWLSTGSLNWASLAIGLVEFAYQHFVKPKTVTNA